MKKCAAPHHCEEWRDSIRVEQLQAMLGKTNQRWTVNHVTEGARTFNGLTFDCDLTMVCVTRIDAFPVYFL